MPILPSPASDEASAGEPGGLADGAHRVALDIGFESLDVEPTVEVVALVLESLRHEPLAGDIHGVAVGVDAGDPRPRVTQPRKVEPGNREAPFVDEFGLARDFEHGVEHVPDVALDVVAEGT